jgi:hypothetical protein
LLASLEHISASLKEELVILRKRNSLIETIRFQRLVSGHLEAWCKSAGVRAIKRTGITGAASEWISSLIKTSQPNLTVHLALMHFAAGQMIVTEISMRISGLM